MDALKQHPEYIRARDHLIEMGLNHEWLLYTIDTENKYTQFLPAGKRGNMSECPYYQGRWRLGGFGAVKCAVVINPLPGTYFDLICGRCHSTCAHFIEKEGRTGV